MEKYLSPNAELITFSNEKILTASGSGCNCHFDISKQNMGLEGVGCSALSGHASENPFGISAPNWTYGD